MPSDTTGSTRPEKREPSFTLAYSSRVTSEVFAGRQLLADAGSLVASLPGGRPRRVIVGTDETVYQLYGARLEASLRGADLDVVLVRMSAGEEQKTLANVMTSLRQLARHGVERHDVLVALGGGVPGDLFGFVAASYMRGIRLIQMPTTLVSQVDSSVGGKVGVDLPEGKNLVGAFKHPDRVIIDYDTLDTLPSDEWVSGTAEVAKHGVIADAGLFEWLEANAEAWRARSTDVGPVLDAAIQVKARIVQEDEREAGTRMYLNYGHTLGHALEAAAGYRGLRHGEAVAWGMAMEARLAAAIGLSDDRFVERQDRLLRSLGLLQPLPALAAAETYDRLFLDKKVKSGRVRWVLPFREPGRVCVRDDIQEQLVRELIDATVGGRLLDR